MRKTNRPRKHGNRHIPPNLWLNPTRYRHPVTSKVYSWPDLTIDAAIDAAKVLNAQLISEPVRKVLGDGDTVDKLAGKFESVYLAQRDLSAETLRDYRNKLNVIVGRFGNHDVRGIGTRDLSVFLERYQPTQRNRYRSLMVMMFRYAQNEGMIETNPAEPLLRMKERVQRQRLTIEGFWAIHEAALPFMQRAMRVALRTLQRREDLVRIRFRDIEDGSIPVIQEKTGAAIRIKIDENLAADIKDCRDAVVSGWLLHQPIEYNKARIGRPLTKDMLTKGFQRARDKIPAFAAMSPATRPSFHEIRALGAILYLRAGKSIEDIQRLLGHTNTQMTRRYLERHGIEFTDAETGPLLVADV